MGSVHEIVITQPDGLAFALCLDGTELRARLSGGGLVAETSAGLDRPALARFFADSATLAAPPWGRWEYKAADDAVELHAGPDGSGGVLLAVSLLASSPDAADWRADGTLVITAAAWSAAAFQIAAECGPDAESSAAL